MRDSSGDLSDLEIARRLSRALAGGTAAEGVSADSGWVRFRSAAPESAAPAGTERFTTWDDILDWSASQTGATAAFVVDPQGFVIGSRGAVPDDGFEGAGAELSHVMGQADGMNPEHGALRSIRLEFPDRVLVGLRTEADEASGFVLAFLDPAHLTPAVGGAILRVLERSLPDLA